MHICNADAGDEKPKGHTGNRIVVDRDNVPGIPFDSFNKFISCASNWQNLDQTLNAKGAQDLEPSQKPAGAAGVQLFN